MSAKKRRKQELFSMSKEQLIDIILKQENVKENAEDNKINHKRTFSSINDVSNTDNTNNSNKNENEMITEPPTKKQKTSINWNNSNNSNNRNKKHKKRGIFDMNKYYQRHIALKFAYLGSKYDGFVRQENSSNTIEEYLFAALIKTCLITDINNCNYSRCGRTDKGVSSLGNVISLNVRSKLKFGKGIIPKTDDIDNNNNDNNDNKDNIDDISEELDYIDMLNNVLPTDIRILSWCPVDIDFNARFQCKYRYYKYLFYENGMNINEMNKAIKLLIGTHDFRNFCKMDVVNVNNFVREIIDITIQPFNTNNNDNDNDKDNINNLWCINIIGSAFLWHQIRFIMAVLFMIGKGNERYDVISYLLDVNQCDGKPQFVMSSDKPLILFDCIYDEKHVKFEMIKFKQQSIDTFYILHQLWRQQNIISNVKEIFWKKCIDGIGSNKDKIYSELSQLDLPSSKKKNKKQRPIKHVKLMKRIKEPSYQQKLDNMNNSKLKKYENKQKQRQFFQNN